MFRKTLRKILPSGGQNFFDVSGWSYLKKPMCDEIKILKKLVGFKLKKREIIILEFKSLKRK